MSSKAIWAMVEFGGFIVLTIAFNWFFRWRHRRPARSYDALNPWTPADRGSHGHRPGGPGGGGGHHHGSGGGDGGGHHGGWGGGGDGGSVGGHHG